MQQTFLNLALTKLSLFHSSSNSSNLLRSVHLITGISIPELLHAERRIQKAGTLAPLKELLSNPLIQRADKFKFKISLKHIHNGKSTSREKVASRLLLEIMTAKGRLDIEVVMVIRRKLIDVSKQHQSAEILLNYTMQQGNEIRTHTQKHKIADRTPIWRPARSTNSTAACAA